MTPLAVESTSSSASIARVDFDRAAEVRFGLLEFPVVVVGDLPQRDVRLGKLRVQLERALGIAP